MRAQGRCEKKAGERAGVVNAPARPQCGQFQALRGGVVKDKILLFRGRDSLRP